MSAVAKLPADARSAAPLATRWLQAWSGLNRRHALGLALATLLMTGLDMGGFVDKLARPGALGLVAFNFATTVLLFSITLLAWSAAVHGRPSGSKERLRAAAIAVFVSGMISAFIVVPAYTTFGMHEIAWQLRERPKPLPPMWLAIVGNTVHLGVFSLLFVVVAEMLQRRAATDSAVLAAQREQATVAREVLESRLAAMQAQVEPQFLFNTLVGIEALYQKDAGAAADNLDRLIQYLRVALPRLREPGSTISAELDLVRAYLAVVTSLHGGRPSLRITVEGSCGGERFYPMLLLPLVQRVVRQDDCGLPDSITIDVRRAGRDAVIVTHIAGAGGCGEDFELARVRERLQGLYGQRASLACVELDGDTTQFTLRVPVTNEAFPP